MDWLTAFGIATLAAGTTIAVVVLAAAGSIRRGLNEHTVRQAQQIKRLAEHVTTLNQQLQDQQTRLQALTEANRRLTEELAALGERLSDGDGVRPRGGGARLLH